MSEILSKPISLVWFSLEEIFEKFADVVEAEDKIFIFSSVVRRKDVSKINQTNGNAFGQSLLAEFFASGILDRPRVVRDEDRAGEDLELSLPLESRQHRADLVRDEGH